MPVYRSVGPKKLWNVDMKRKKSLKQILGDFDSATTVVTTHKDLGFSSSTMPRREIDLPAALRREIELLSATPRSKIDLSSMPRDEPGKESGSSLREKPLEEPDVGSISRVPYTDKTGLRIGYTDSASTAASTDSPASTVSTDSAASRTGIIIPRDSYAAPFNTSPFYGSPFYSKRVDSVPARKPSKKVMAPIAKLLSPRLISPDLTTSGVSQELADRAKAIFRKNKREQIDLNLDQAILSSKKFKRVHFPDEPQLLDDRRSDRFREPLAEVIGYSHRAEVYMMKRNQIIQHWNANRHKLFSHGIDFSSDAFNQWSDSDSQEFGSEDADLDHVDFNSPERSDSPDEFHVFPEDPPDEGFPHEPELRSPNFLSDSHEFDSTDQLDLAFLIED